MYTHLQANPLADLPVDISADRSADTLADRSADPSADPPNYLPTDLLADPQNTYDPKPTLLPFDQTLLEDFFMIK